MRWNTSATRWNRASDRTAALMASEARFRSFTSLGSDWYWEQDAELRFTAISGNFCEVTGFAVEEHLGPRALGIAERRGTRRRLGAAAGAPRVARDVLRRRGPARPSRPRRDVRGDQRRSPYSTPTASSPATAASGAR